MRTIGASTLDSACSCVSAAYTVNATNVCWEITSRCNDRCAFCYRPDTREELPAGEADLDALAAILAN